MESPNDHLGWVCARSWGFYMFNLSAQAIGYEKVYFYHLKYKDNKI